jgi:hypothetical protein
LIGISDSINFFWSHRSWPLLNFSSFSGKCATTLVSGDALLMRLQGYAPSPFWQCFLARAFYFTFLGNQRVF